MMHSERCPLAQRVHYVAVALGVSLMAATSSAQTSTQTLKTASLEELLATPITLVTRQDMRVGQAGAAVSVITRDDIRRSGVTTIPDALALADGMHVARFNNGSWAISARGFNGSTPNKLLVMIDGRNEFTPLFAGVFWNMLDYVLDDIERIEVIRGPGATLWGANAVNGVINIVTRHARDTRGSLATVVAGNEDPAIIELRHGGGSEATSYRVYGKFAMRDSQQFSTGGRSEDGRRRGQAGFRVDADRGTTSWLFKGDVIHSRDAFVDRQDGEWTGLAMQARIVRALSATSSLQARTHYRREYRNIERQLTHHLDTIDLDAQHAFGIGARQDAIWGGGYRSNRDRTDGSPVIEFEPASRSYPVFNAFVQDEIALVPNTLFMTAGVKVEHNAFSGVDWQPNLRARWLVGPHVAWAAVARAVRRPTRFDDDIVVKAANEVVVARGSDEFVSEAMTAVEGGYRVVFRGVSVDASIFRQRYDDLRSQEAPATGFIPVIIGNTLNGTSSGIDLAATIQPKPWWRMHASYSYLTTAITRDANSRDVSQGINEFNDPHHLFSLRGAFDIARTVEVDAWLRHVGSLPNPAVPAYTELNMRTGWQMSPRLELALIGQDLLHGQHAEFGTAVPRRIEFERSLRALLTVRLPN